MKVWEYNTVELSVENAVRMQVQLHLSKAGQEWELAGIMQPVNDVMPRRDWIFIFKRPKESEASSK
jgi:hypothetical protein